MNTRKTDCLSIIIATYNSEKTLGKSLSSIRSQSVLPRVYIVDGGSVDKTLEIVSQYKDVVTHLISEPDQGVYDAWNKALKNVTTQWVVFLGSDDWFYDSHAIESLCGELESVDDDIVFVFGDVLRKKINDETLVSIENNHVSESLLCGYHNTIPFTHTGCAQRFSLFDRFGFFSDKLKIAGDFEFYSRTMKTGLFRAMHVDGYKICMGDEGMSNNNSWRVRLLSEKNAILIEHGKGIIFKIIYNKLKIMYYTIMRYMR